MSISTVRPFNQVRCHQTVAYVQLARLAPDVLPLHIAHIPYFPRYRNESGSLSLLSGESRRTDLLVLDQYSHEAVSSLR